MHCIVSCLCEIVKRYSDVDYRPFYFGVWDMPFSISEEGVIRYYTDSATYDGYLRDFETLFGLKAHTWYDPLVDKKGNVQTLLELLDNRPEYRHIVVQIDLSLMPERENKFHQKPFPHYVILYPTERADAWFMFDPDFRWEGVVSREQVLEAIYGNAFGGGFYLDALHVKAPSCAEVERFYRASFDTDANPLTACLQRLVTRVAQAEMGWTPVRLSEALKQLNVLAIRKYSYDYALMFFSDALGYERELYEQWAQQIRDLVQCYTTTQYTALKMAAASSFDEQLLGQMADTLAKADAIELALKKELNRQLELWLILQQAGVSMR
ncbi:DUF6005 family protein [Paenibacillus athensensis]|uniref:DUF6005 family protein n=1 Tax=Paenibacillus athensensis TaxID=1967502 RepID=UPI001E544929|nr:DUF6005 family protein [Paenibacillus athensensis]